MQKTLTLDLYTADEKPENIERFRDKYLNPKQTNFVVYDDNDIPRFAVYEDGSFKYATNKRKIPTVKYWFRIPMGEEIDNNEK